MHSLWKKQQDDQKNAKQGRRSSLSAAARRRRDDLANQYHNRVDKFIRGKIDDGEVDAVHDEQFNVNNFKFRDRSPTKELGHANVSPNRYIPEKTRIENAVNSANRPLDKGKYTGGASGALMRPRRRDQELHPPVKYTPATETQRVCEILENRRGVLSSDGQHPMYHTYRCRSPDKWQAGEFIAGSEFYKNKLRQDVQSLGEKYSAPIASVPRTRDRSSELGDEMKFGMSPGRPSVEHSPKSYYRATGLVAAPPTSVAESYDKMDMRIFEDSLDRQMHATDILKSRLESRMGNTKEATVRVHSRSNNNSRLQEFE